MYTMDLFGKGKGKSRSLLNNDETVAVEMKCDNDLEKGGQKDVSVNSNQAVKLVYHHYVNKSKNEPFGD